jgi:predicted DNA-binding protein with PD1-like motif
MRTIAHPGASLPERATAIKVTPASREHVRLNPGQDLFTFLERLLEDRGLPGAFFNLEGGTLGELTIMTGGPGTDTPIGFHGPWQIAAPAAVQAGSGIVGVDEQGNRVSHCHAAFVDADARLVGGHLMRGKAIAGPEGLDIELITLADARFARRLDPETQFAIFHPEAA